MSEIPQEDLQQMREDLEDRFDEFKGRYKRDTLNEKVKDLTDHGLNNKHITQFREYMNEHANFSIIKQSAPSSAGYSVRRSFEERMEKHSEDVDEQFHDVFYELVANGCSPNVAKATITYLTTDKTQDEAGEQYGITNAGQSIRGQMELARYLLPDDKITGSVKTSGAGLSANPCGNLQLKFKDESDEAVIRQLAVSNGWGTAELAAWIADKAQEELQNRS